MANFVLTSTDIVDNQPIQKKFTLYGENETPRLSWSNAPEKTKSFALIVSDPDAPSGTFYHWVLFNIPKSRTSIDKSYETERRKEDLADGSSHGKTDFGKIGYDGPRPPSGTHHYHFTVYALDLEKIDIGKKPTAQQLLGAMDGHILAQAELMGTYQAPQNK